MSSSLASKLSTQSSDFQSNYTANEKLVADFNAKLAEIHKGQSNEPDRLAKNLKLLKQLADALLAGFNPDRAAGEMAEQVAQAIRRYQSRVDGAANPAPKAKSG